MLSYIMELETERDKLKSQQNQLESEVERLKSELLVSKRQQINQADGASWELKNNEITLTSKVLEKEAWGEISMGTYYGQKVAVKQVHTVVLPSHLVHIHKEIDMIAKLRHPNLVLFIGAIFEMASAVNSPIVIVTELLEVSLRNAYQRKQIIAPQAKLQVLRDTVAALVYLHLQHSPVVHGNVSSGTVYLEPLPHNLWKGKLSDSVFAHISQTTAGIYSAPEMLTKSLSVSGSPGVAVTPKADVYSFGVLTCETLTGQLPLPETLSDMVQSLATSWPTMYKLVIGCIDNESPKRPDTGSVLDSIERELDFDYSV